MTRLPNRSFFRLMLVKTTAARPLFVCLTQVPAPYPLGTSQMR